MGLLLDAPYKAPKWDCVFSSIMGGVRTSSQAIKGPNEVPNSLESLEIICLRNFFTKASQSWP
jgi:hypothetical protein